MTTWMSENLERKFSNYCYQLTVFYNTAVTVKYGFTNKIQFGFFKPKPNQNFDFRTPLILHNHVDFCILKLCYVNTCILILQ